MSVPSRFTEKALSRPVSDQQCRRCALTYKAHSGRLCALCGGAVEHHDTVPADGGRPLLFAECLAGRARMATARQAAGVALTDLDLFVLETNQQGLP